MTLGQVIVFPMLLSRLQWQDGLELVRNENGVDFSFFHHVLDTHNNFKNYFISSPHLFNLTGDFERENSPP